MKTFCTILGFSIDREKCGASGNHPLCRECSRAGNGIRNQPAKAKQRIKKRCECGRSFIPKSNRQGLVRDAGR